ncbi:MAG: Fur family transcriptional regulator [Rhodospirillales bacterium]|jgi:Fur family ferric uptake transcriptional regulator|nr:Fur family transcriptional regulator [Rhodospirillales bacterium]
MLSRIERVCREKGLRMTEQRRVVAQVLSEASDHPDVEQVYQRAVGRDSNISIATVYRTVRLFEEAKIIERHDFGDGRARFEETGFKQHHHHLIDLKSGKVIEFESEKLERIKKEIARDLGYELVGDRLELYGLPIGSIGAGEEPDDQ